MHHQEVNLAKVKHLIKKKTDERLRYVEALKQSYAQLQKQKSDFANKEKTKNLIKVRQHNSKKIKLMREIYQVLFKNDGNNKCFMALRDL
jgi:hypothetical protein